MIRGKSRRCIQIAEDIYKVLSFTLLKELSDPRLRTLTITHVDMAADLGTAKVFFISSEESVTAAMKDTFLQGMRSAKPYWRRQLSQALTLRVIPNLVFFYDDHLSGAFALDRLISHSIS